MTEEELKNWFWDKFNNCYPVKFEPRRTLMYYDINYIRSRKLANILDKEVDLPKEVNGKCLFEIEYDNLWFGCNYHEIWSVLELDHRTYQEIRFLINEWLEEDPRFDKMIPKYFVTKY